MDIDIEKLMYAIEDRPGAFVSDRRLDYLTYFLDGYFFHGRASKNLTPIDEFYIYNFHSWVRRWITENLNIQFESDEGWYEHITASTKDNEEAVDLFFKLARLFFKEYHETD